MQDERDPAEVIAECLEALEAGDSVAIDRALAEHPKLAREIQGALAAALALRSETGPPPLAAGATHASGTTIGRFTVVRELGRGGAGVVLLVRDPGLGQLLALKLLSARLPSASELERFDRETHALARLRHPNIVRIHEVGRTADRVPWFTMEYLEGSSLAEILADPARRSSLEGQHQCGAAELGAKLADALDQVHREGIVHRDVKPANVLVDTRGEPRLVDFGIARADDANTVTRTGTGPGTPAYMAPEQVVGEPVGPWTDVYGLGATLYECLTGRAPFGGRSEAEIMGRILKEDAPRPRSIARGIARDLETIVLKAIARSPAQRYASAAGLRDDLQAFLGHKPIQARPASVVTRSVRWSQRHPMLTTILAMAVLALASAAFFSSWRQLRFGHMELETYLQLQHRCIALEENLALREPLLDKYLPLAEREKIWRDKQQLLEELRRRDQAMERALGAYRSQVRFGLPVIAQGAREGLVKTLKTAEADARQRHDLVRVSQLWEELREYCEQPQYSVSIDTKPAESEIYLYRYELNTTLPSRNVKVPRLVPVPVDSTGRHVRFPDLQDGFQPGDECLVVTEVEPHGQADSMSLAKGDLVLSLDESRDFADAFVTTVLNGGIADQAGVGPYDRICSAGGRMVSKAYEWATLPNVFVLSGRSPDIGPFACEVDTVNGRVVLHHRKSLDGFHKDNVGEFLVSNVNDPPAEIGGKPILTAEHLFEMRVGGIEEALRETPVRELAMEVLDPDSGAGRVLRFAANEPLGFTAERTAYPLVLLRTNRLQDGKAHLPFGSYVALIRAPGRLDLRLPFLITDSGYEKVIEMPMASSVPKDFVCIEAGSFLSQGDRTVSFSESVKLENVDRFFIGRYEVTVSEWLEFCRGERIIDTYRDLLRARREDVEKRDYRWMPTDLPLPRLPNTPHPWEITALDDGQVLFGRMGPTSPIVGVNESYVLSFLAWKNKEAERLGMPWTFRLASDLEWEKAARGTDARVHVWGDHFDFSLACSYFSSERDSKDNGVAKLEPVGSYPTDESPYGVRDMAGSASEWNLKDLATFPWQIHRGGSWTTTVQVYFRAACRLSGSGAYPQQGLRLVAVPREE